MKCNRFSTNGVLVQNQTIMHGPEILIPMLAIVGFFGAIITFVYMFFKSRNSERMALIESGQSAEIFASKKLDDKSNALKYGMLIVGIGLGFLVGLFLEEVFRLPDATGVISMTFVGGGLGLILFYSRISRILDED